MKSKRMVAIEIKHPKTTSYEDGGLCYDCADVRWKNGASVDNIHVTGWGVFYGKTGVRDPYTVLEPPDAR